MQTVLNVVNIIVDINDALVKKGYVLNVYERKNNTFLVDIIKSRMQKNQYIISVVKAFVLVCGFTRVKSSIYPVDV